jgi:hypothetical protein
LAADLLFELIKTKQEQTQVRLEKQIRYADIVDISDISIFGTALSAHSSHSASQLIGPILMQYLIQDNSKMEDHY